MHIKKNNLILCSENGQTKSKKPRVLKIPKQRGNL